MLDSALVRNVGLMLKEILVFVIQPLTVVSYFMQLSTDKPLFGIHAFRHAGDR